MYLFSLVQIVSAQHFSEFTFSYFVHVSYHVRTENISFFSMDICAVAGKISENTQNIHNIHIYPEYSLVLRVIRFQRFKEIPIQFLFLRLCSEE